MEALIIPIGSRCMTPLLLQQLGLRDQALPFDWVASTLGRITMALRDHCRAMIREEDIPPELAIASPPYTDEQMILKNSYNMLCPHLFNRKLPIAPQIPDALEQVRRRGERLFRLFQEREAARAPIIFFLYHESSPNLAVTSQDEFESFTAYFQEYYPELPFKILYVKDTPLPELTVSPTPQILYAHGNYSAVDQKLDFCPQPQTLTKLQALFTRLFTELKVVPPRSAMGKQFLGEAGHDGFRGS